MRSGWSEVLLVELKLQTFNNLTPPLGGEGVKVSGYYNHWSIWYTTLHTWK